jgi:GNAT superfamily N-acetyltransferase
MAALSSRPYGGQVDLQAALELVRMCRACEDCDPWPPYAELRQALRAGGERMLANTQLWLRGPERLAALATVWDGEALLSYIHPQEPREELMAEALAWGQAHARIMARQRGEHATLLVPIRDGDRGADLLERSGLSAQEWSLQRMARSLAEPIAPPQLPPGFVVHPATTARELADSTALYQEIFTARASVVQERLALGRSASDLRATDLIAVGPNGELAAFCLCLADTHASAPGDRREGWIDWLGTHPAFRERGLGRAILRAALQQLRDVGANTALLGTGSWNTVARYLFATEGFQLLHRVQWYAWEADDRMRSVGA